MIILGLNAHHGDSSAAVFRDGQLVAAMEEERLNRVKHWAGVPMAAASECLGPYRPAHVAISRDPKAHFWRKVAHAVTHPSMWRRAIDRGRNLAAVAQVPSFDGAAVHHVEHHRAHLASAFFCSPFEEAAVASIDGLGDYASVMWGMGRGNRIEPLGAVHFPHSLGFFYTLFTQHLGFPNYGDEYKMMGLAAFGEPRFAAEVRQVVRTTGGVVRLDLGYFTHHRQGVELEWTAGSPRVGYLGSRRMTEVFGPRREPRSELTQAHRDLAASVQLVLEENYFSLLRTIHERTGQKRLCLAGGVALNCAANGKLFDQTPFEELFIQPAAHDAGTSIGAALHVQHEVLGLPRSFVMRHCHWGTEFDAAEIERAIRADSVTARRLSPDEIADETARLLADGNIVGWFQGRMEFGPRALGARSILADPRRAEMKDVLNERIKYREPFRPFCPSILAERVSDWFETSYPSPFMVQAYPIRPSRRAEIPAVTHADGTGRLQTVERDANPLYWSLLRRFEQITGVPVLINTSFNENEPIVHTPEQALSCFLRTNMDALVMGPFLMLQSTNPRRGQPIGGRIKVGAR